MSYRPLKEYPVNEIWRWLTKNINDALDLIHGLASRVLGEKNSIVLDTEDSKIQLVNDLTDAELQALGYGTVYGTQEDGIRGFKKDLGGYVGTKEVDETNIGNDKLPVYKSALDKVVYETKPASASTAAGFLLLPYRMWRVVLGATFAGYMDVQMQIASDPDFSTLVYDLDSGTAQTYWMCFSAASGEYIAWDAAGMPATDVMGAIYTGTFVLAKNYYMRWRAYEHGTSNYGDWIPGGVI
jgi:hypothetical protein